MAKSKTAEQATITIPLGEIEAHGYQRELSDGGTVALESRGLHINVQLGVKAAQTFARIRTGLRRSGAKFADGRPVWKNSEVLQYLLEQIADDTE